MATTTRVLLVLALYYFGENLPADATIDFFAKRVELRLREHQRDILKRFVVKYKCTNYMQKTFIQKRSMFLDLRIRLTKQSIIFLLDALAECLENASFMSYNNETGFPGATTSSASMGDIITATTETSVWWPVDDPCSNYTVLDQPWRNVANGKNYAHKCDDEYDGFVKQWYRLIGGAGTGIPSTCQATNHCGAYVPIYLDGDLPNATGAVVTIPLCGTHVNGCCDPDWPSYNIPHSLRAKHCGGYFVYELEPTTGCYAAYCGTDL